MPTGYMITGTTRTAPPGYTLSGTIEWGNTYSYSLAPMPTPLIEAIYATLNNKIYAIGGRDQSTGTISTLVQIYDPATDTWSQGASLKLGLYGGEALSYTLPSGAGVIQVNGASYSLGSNSYSSC